MHILLLKYYTSESKGNGHLGGGDKTMGSGVGVVTSSEVSKQIIKNDHFKLNLILDHDCLSKGFSGKIKFIVILRKVNYYKHCIRTTEN